MAGRGEGAGFGWQPLGYQWDTLAEILVGAGYQTAAFSENPWLTDAMGMTQGFETFLELPPGAPDAMPASVASWLEGRDPDRPTFLFLNIMDAHDPYPVRAENPFLPPWVTLDELRALRDTVVDLQCNTDGRIRELDLLRRLYLDGVLQADTKLGRVLNVLESAGLDDLRIVVLSDHGEHFGEQRRVLHEVGLAEALLRVPLVVSGLPGVEPAVIETPVQVIDVFPTVAQWAGVDAPASPIARVLPTTTTGERHPVFAEYGETEYAARLLPGAVGFLAPMVIAERRRFCRAEDRSQGNRTAVIDPPWKLVVHDDGRRRLVDVERDPQELVDQSDRHPEIVARLAGAATWLRSAAAPHEGTAPATVEPARAERLRALGYVVGDR